MLMFLKTGTFFRTLLFFSCAFVVFIAVATADEIEVENKHPWTDELTKQIAEDEACELTFIIHIREFELAGDNVIDGRARCADAREFFFKRGKETEKFTFEKCAVAEC